MENLDKQHKLLKESWKKLQESWDDDSEGPIGSGLQNDAGEWSSDAQQELTHVSDQGSNEDDGQDGGDRDADEVLAKRDREQKTQQFWKKIIPLNISILNELSGLLSLAAHSIKDNQLLKDNIAKMYGQVVDIISKEAEKYNAEQGEDIITETTNEPTNNNIGGPMYAVQARMTFRDQNGSTNAYDYPTFYLDGSVQGITDEGHARRIAQAMLSQPFNAFPIPSWPKELKWHISVAKL